MLDRSLYDHLQEQDRDPEIQPLPKQLLVALGTLRGVGILQTDIKQDNIMFVNVHDQPLGVKLIDFREAIPASNIKLVMELQPTGYRHTLRETWFSQTWHGAKINNLPSECRQNRKKSKTRTRPSGTHSQGYQRMTC
ncbi:hypothetical protein Q8A73_008285 [Channa argus]|nr:hypothetical protein Q8A73_008285 [Channa argus]